MGNPGFDPERVAALARTVRAEAEAIGAIEPVADGSTIDGTMPDSQIADVTKGIAEALDSVVRYHAARFGDFAGVVDRALAEALSQESRSAQQLEGSGPR
ncbi:hypothetical protein [Nocardia sp. NPDC057227]|uniref:hypothetical protein n=1 Tax=Nocardia sp. NPDC057227 TaxID=3346056 RepID=UPI003631D0AE